MTNDDDRADEKKTTVLADVATAKLSDDEEQRKRKGKAKIVIVSKECKEESEKKSEEKRCFDHVPRKIRRTLRFPQPDFENPNGASSSSPCSSLPFENSYRPSTSSSSSSSPCSFLNYENYMAMMMRRPPNPTYRSSPYSPLTDRTIPERCGLSQRWGINRGFNKKPRVASFSRREMPRWLVHVMRDMNAQDATLIFEKTLLATDLNPHQSRFLMPFDCLIRNDFLTPEERSIVEEEDMDMDNDEKIEVGALLVDPRSVKWGVVIKRSEMTTCSGNKSWGYCLDCGWNDIVNANEFKVGDNIVVWSFRSRGVLCFALVLVPLPLFL
ncbi:PREDICTED: B3 domain-containing protein At1g05930-like [Camelina sativa]|uniref:B3 domain-containing protein At1g05930-like n=1 Tax=Camelina sativa TaxID=90675 RepID=A0ABM0VXK9_CAMSA|nr:PREDICTED: B3 domain-containing protein At1g05930-like [Camelina sativa]